MEVQQTEGIIAVSTVDFHQVFIFITSLRLLSMGSCWIFLNCLIKLLGKHARLRKSYHRYGPFLKVPFV